jgi:eukaryotic-like serine/threonine-protein kinase
MELPARIGKYELIEFLGGGMSQVYRARDTVICRTVALKILTPEGCREGDVKARFLQEARMAGSASHENVINIFDFGEDRGQPFLVMEFLKGDNLGTLIRQARTGDLINRLGARSFFPGSTTLLSLGIFRMGKQGLPCAARLFSEHVQIP